MVKIIQQLIVLSALITPFFAYSQDSSVFNEGFPSHCKSNESTFLNAKMQKVITPAGGGYHLKPTGKVLSLCYKDSKTDNPMIAYRYGIIGNIEFEKTATPKNPFFFYRRSEGKLGSEMIFFNNGNINYYVRRALGMGSGVSIDVFRNGQQLAELFSGNDREFDFYANDLAKSVLPREMLSDKTPRDEQMRSPNPIKRIRREYKQINEYKEYIKHDLDTGTTGQATAYEGKWTHDIDLIKTVFGSQLGQSKYEIYYDGSGKPFFIFERMYHYNAPATMTAKRAAQLLEEEDTVYPVYDPTKTEVEEWRYYYDGDYVVRVLDPNKKQVKNLEKANNALELGQNILEQFKKEITQ